MQKLTTSVSTVALVVSGCLTTAAMAQSSGGIDEVVVTARKKAESLQDVPIAVSALGEAALDELGVDVFQDYLLQIPSVTAGGSGPGQNTIYIRGVASTTPNLSTAGVAGLAPNVALYLDEQPLSQPGRNLDVYAADLERIEVLAGPQGTLFGASSQAGVVRLITNKPKLGVTEFKASTEVSFTRDGEPSNKLELVANLPINDKLAIRGVVYSDHQGGYIDNVAGTRTLRDSARFRDAGTVRPNGVPVNTARAGFQSATGIQAAKDRGDTGAAVFSLGAGDRDADLSNVTFREATNQSLVEDDFNDATYNGFRLSGLMDVSDDWTLTLGMAQQSLEADGVFFADPELNDLEIQRFEEDTLEDDFTNVNWTLEGRLGALDVLYTGAFTDRETDQRIDYTDYLFVGQYLPYYLCDSTVSYPEYNAYYSNYAPHAGLTPGLPSGVCQPPNLFVTSHSETEVWTHEFRVLTPQDLPIRATAGVFYSDLELRERNNFNYPNNVNADIFPEFAGGDPVLEATGFSANSAFPNVYTSQTGPFAPETVFRNDIKRTDKQFGLFSEVTFDLIPNRLSMMVGGRHYDVEVDMEGSANSSFGNGFRNDVNAFGTNISDLYDGDGSFTFIGDTNTATHITFNKGQTFDEIKAALAAVDGFSVNTRGAITCAPNAICDAEIQGILNALNAPDKAEAKGEIYKATLNYTPADDLLYYITYSEGFRPGLLNRPGGAPGPNGYTVPFELQTDEVKNYELGWKTQTSDGMFRFNGNVFFVEIDRLQTTIFDPSIANLFFSDNAANAEVKGIEGDFIWMVKDVPGLELGGAFSVLDTEITEVLIPTSDVVVGKELAFAPNLSANLRARYEWSAQNGLAHFGAQVIYTGSSRSDIIEMNAGRIDSSTVLNMATGLSYDRWGFEVFAQNVTDERAETSNNFVNDVNRVTVIRPLTVGLRVNFRY